MPSILIAMALLATPDFPGAIQQQLGLAAPPACTTCHATNAGGIGTVVKPFGIYLRSRGLQPFDETSLRNALLADIAEHHSSNSSGISDIDALKAGEDPNAPGGATGPTPAYGCSSSGSANLLTLLALAAWLWRCASVLRSGRTPAQGKGDRCSEQHLDVLRTAKAMRRTAAMHQLTKESYSGRESS